MSRGATMTAPRAVIFDMDGTLTEPILDFDAMRAEIGLPDGVPILGHLDGLTAAERAHAEEVLLRHERAAIAQATLADGCADLLRPPARPGDADLDPDPQRARGGRDVRAHVHLPVSRDLHARGRATQALARGSARAVPIDGRRPGSHAGGRRLQVRRDGGPRRGLPDGARQIGKALAQHQLAEWGSPDLVVRSLRELLPLFGR